jgi:N-acyl-L-homoserine lactone synthetase
MENLQHVVPARKQGSIFEGLLRGYRFSVCESPAAVARAIDVRRRVYRDLSGYDVPVPDEYDGRSWFLLAEQVSSGEAVGSMRVTPRSLGPLEAEEYFRLPASLLAPGVVEITRFAILPEHRQSKRFLPVVALGLYKLVCHFTRQLRASHVVICSKPERSFAYQWLGFSRTGLSARYTKLADAEHELLSCDVRGDMEQHRAHRYWEFVFEIEHQEIALPGRIPPFGLGFTRLPWGMHLWKTA